MKWFVFHAKNPSTSPTLGACSSSMTLLESAGEPSRDSLEALSCEGEATVFGDAAAVGSVPSAATPGATVPLVAVEAPLAALAGDLGPIEGAQHRYAV